MHEEQRKACRVVWTTLLNDDDVRQEIMSSSKRRTYLYCSVLRRGILPIVTSDRYRITLGTSLYSPYPSSLNRVGGMLSISLVQTDFGSCTHVYRIIELRSRKCKQLINQGYNINITSWNDTTTVNAATQTTTPFHHIGRPSISR